MINDQQRDFINRIDCSRCHIQNECDQIRSECPKANLQTLTVDDDAILKTEAGTYIKKCDEAIPDFTKTTGKDFETHQYGKITRCKYKNKILSFFSSEKEVQGLCLFFFSHGGNYYRAFRDTKLTDAALEKQVLNFLYPDKKSFMYSGWLCRFDRQNLLFYLYTPAEMEQPQSMRNSEFEASSPAQAIEFINCY